MFLAQPVVTPIERLRRKDKEVARVLEEKQRLIEEILNIPHEELESITESMIETYGRTLAQLFTLPHILPMEELVGREVNTNTVPVLLTVTGLRFIANLYIPVLTNKFN